MPSKRRGAHARFLAGGVLIVTLYAGGLLAVLPGMSGSGAPQPTAEQPASGASTASSNGAHVVVVPVPTQRPRPDAPGQTAQPGSPTGSPAPIVSNAYPVSTGSPAPIVSGTPNLRLVYHVPILMYHRIIPAAEAASSLPSMVVPPALFSAQLQVLHASGWRTITLATLAAYMRAGRQAPAKSFVITIDDGWADGFTYAFPILRNYGDVATYFVVGDRIGGSQDLSAAQLRELEAAGNEIGSHTQRHVDLRHLTIPAAQQEIEQGSTSIARAVGHRPVSFSYPMGGWNGVIAPLVAATPDLQIGVITSRGKENWSTRFVMPRIGVQASSSPGLLLTEFARYR